VTKIKGKGNSKDKLGNAFIALLVDIEEEEEEEEEVKEQCLDLYFTSIKSLLTKPAIAYARSPYAEVLIKELNNQALTYQLIAQVPKPEKAEETITFTTRSISRYNLHYFYRVIINTRASKYSTARYGQFQAL
jgi:hypothetical protein